MPVVQAALPVGATIVRVPVPTDLAAAHGLEKAGRDSRHPELDVWLAAHEPWSSPWAGAPMGLIHTSGTTGGPEGILREPISTPEQNRALLQMIFDALGIVATELDRRAKSDAASEGSPLSSTACASVDLLSRPRPARSLAA